MADVTYNIKDEATFDGMTSKLEEMSEQEKQTFMVLLQGYQAGVQVGMRIAEKQQDESA